MTENKWIEEVKALQEGDRADFWKVESGQHSIKFLDDGVAHQFEWEGEVVDKINFKVEVKGKEYTWSVTKGRTLTSLYGQIAAIGQEWGSLKGEVITLLVKGEKMARQYIVMEALDLAKKNKVVNEKVGGK